MENILSDLRSIIGDDLKPSYETRLKISYPPQGLAEAFNPAFEITTEARG
jgi:hypothetical protein